MTYPSVARGLLVILAGLQGLATVAIDFNHNHARNAEWSGPARFQVAWKATAFAALAVLEIGLLVTDGPSSTERFYLAAALIGIPMLGFFAALFGRSYYGAVLDDAHGAPPIPIRVLGSQYLIDINLAAEIAGVLSLIVIVLLFRR